MLSVSTYVLCVCVCVRVRVCVCVRACWMQIHIVFVLHHFCYNVL